MGATLLHTEDDRRLIQRAYRKLLGSIKAEIKPEDKKNLRTAYELAVRAHSKQRRKSGEPYILHPIEVARICAEEIGLGPTSIVCALLHDVVEDTDFTLKDIGETFGEKIAMIVDGLTKLQDLYDVRSPQAENFKKILTTLAKDVRVVLIKMADRLHNMRTLGAMPKHKQLKIASETIYIYAPLAHRLGLYNIKTEFQDLCMKITNSDNYKEIATKLQATKLERNRYINEFIKPLTAEMDEIGVSYRITGRPKSISSIWNKIKTKGVPFEEIYDLFAVRIIVKVPLKREKRICWEVYSIVTDVHTPIPERLKDWVTTPKANGYESLHTTVVGPGGRYVEVQIRSERMDEIAERGFAAHWKYKGVKSQKNDVFSTWLDGVREVLENPSTDAVEFISDFKSNLFSEEIYVYTPKGDMKMLPKGATALDFAFSIHSMLGYNCTAVKVNNKLEPLGYKLQNGDQVSVITSKNQKPNGNWLNYVITGKAKSKIRSVMREEQRKRGEFGKETLMRKLKNIKADFETNADDVAKHYGFDARPPLYIAIAEENLGLNDLKSFKVEAGKIIFEKKAPQIEHIPPASISSKSRKYIGTPKLLINGENADQYEYSLASCCNPVMGDGVFAYTTVSDGIKIHRTACPNATNLMAHYGYRIMKAEWTSSENTSFVTELVIQGVDGKGVAQSVTGAITNQLGLEMRSISMDGDQGYFEGRIGVVVQNTDQLNYAIKYLKNLVGVSSVTRVE